jgi:putative nucleotidyltransferase with HDIG domain
MSDPARFLHALSQALSTMALYGDEHPATTRVAESAHERLLDLQGEDPMVQITFLAGEVLFGEAVQPELAGWEWSERLAAAGIERLEFTESVDFSQFERLLSHLAARLGIRPAHTADVRQSGSSPFRLGLVTLGEPEPGRVEGPLSVARLSYSLHEERDTVGWIHEEIRNGAPLPLIEADAVVRSLSLAMHAERAMVLPLLQLKEFDQYTTTHSMNVSVLAMALGEYLELGASAVRSLGFAALLHDLGKVCIPQEILNKPGRLTEEERRVVEQHPIVGAKLLLDSPDSMELAAIVAYEHHIMMDGGGYPRLPDARGAEYASRLVHICDVYDALRTRRPYRDAWESERTIGYIESRAGIEFDPAIVRSFVGMMRRWDSRMAQAG